MDKLNEDGVTLEEVMTDDFPRIYLHRMKDNPDGSCTMTFNTNKAFDNLYKKDKGRKRATEKGIGNYILEILTKAVDKKDGYEIRKLKDTSKCEEIFLEDNLDKLPPDGGQGGHY